MAVETLTGEGMPTHEGDLSIEGHGMEPIPERPLRLGRPGLHGLVHAEPRAGGVLHRHPRRGRLPAARVRDRRAGDHRRQRRRLGPRRPAGARWARRPAWPRCRSPALPFGKRIVVPGLLNWLSSIGWDGINSVFGAAAITHPDRAAVRRRPAHHRRLPGRARHLRLRGDPHLREVHGRSCSASCSWS